MLAETRGSTSLVIGVNVGISGIIANKDRGSTSLVIGANGSLPDTIIDTDVLETCLPVTPM
jgi:hypothetical protein